MGLRFDPVGGGQFKQAIQQIVEAERVPVKQLEARKKLEETKLKTFQDFKSKFSNFDKTLAEFSNFKKFRELKVDLGDSAPYVDVTIDKEKAEAGSYQLEVSQLAKRASVMSNTFANPDEPSLGIGFVVVKTPEGDSREVFVDSKDASLRGIASLINKSENLGIHASVVNDQADPEKPWRLIVSSKKDGLSQSMELPELYFMDGEEDLWFAERNDADNALLRVDGFEIEAPSNELKDFMTGVNLKLKQARPDQPITVNISEDYQKVAGKVKGLVDQINSILEFITKQNAVDEKSDTRATFTGDSSLQSVEYRLRNLLHEGFPTFPSDAEDVRWVFTHQLGFEFEKTGQITFKEDKFTKALQNDFQGVTEAITGENGLAMQLREVVAGYTRSPDGMLVTRETNLRNRIKRIDDDIAQKERRIEQRQQRLTEQYSRLQGSLANLQKQQQYLSATMGGGGGGNLVSQLLGG